MQVSSMQYARAHKTWLYLTCGLSSCLLILYLARWSGSLHRGSIGSDHYDILGDISNSTLGVSLPSEGKKKGYY